MQYGRFRASFACRSGSWGGQARDNRQFINAVFWILRTWAPWRDLPPDYGCWSNTHRRFVGENLVTILFRSNKKHHS